MQRITNWKGKRAGAAITVTGIDMATREVVKIVGIRYMKPTIVAGRWSVLACLDDTDVELVVEA